MKTLKNIIQVLLMTLIMISCNQNDKTLELQSELQTELSATNKAVATYQDKTLIMKNNSDIIMKFTGGQLDYKFTFEGSINAKLSDNIGKDDSEQVIIENSETEEYITVSNFVMIDHNTARFDAVTSSGVILNSIDLSNENISYFVNDHSNRFGRVCPPCAVFVIGLIAEVVIELADDDLDSNCNAAIDACSENGGVPSVELNEGWFSSSCTVTCNLPE